MALHFRPRDSRGPSVAARKTVRRFALWVVAIATVLFCALVHPNVASADPLLGGDAAPATGQLLTQPTTLTTGTATIPAGTAALVNGQIPLDPVAAVIAARGQADILQKRLFDAKVHAREVMFAGGDVAAAGAEVDRAQAELNQASARVLAALRANEAKTQLLERQEQERVYGPGGPSVLDQTASIASTSAGVVSGMAEGTAVGLWDIGGALVHGVTHPIETADRVVAFFSQPAPTEEQLVARQVAALEQERFHRVVQVSAPFGTAKDDGFVLGHDILAPVAGGELLGGAVSVLGRGYGALTSRLTTAAAAPLEVDATTAAMMTRMGLTQESRLYRWTDPEFIQPDGTMAGNPHSMALVNDFYNPVPNRYYQAMLDGGRTPAELEAIGLSPLAPTQVTAGRLGPSLNVTATRAPHYGKPGQALISISVRDLLERGARIFPDEGAVAQGLRPMIVTTPRPVPVVVEEILPP
jgi:hypothetical protein